MARIKLFAAFREKLGKSEVTLKIEGKKPVAELLRNLKAEYPQLKELLERGNAIIAVNHQASDAKTLIGDRDEIAIFPPVSGG